jgi:hypothetical protein
MENVLCLFRGFFAAIRLDVSVISGKSRNCLQCWMGKGGSRAQGEFCPVSTDKK